MKSRLHYLVLGICLSLSCLFSVAQAKQLPDKVNDQPLPSLSGMLDHVMPAIVNIVAEGRPAMGPAAAPPAAPPKDPNAAPANPNNNEDPNNGSRMVGFGSGVIIDATKGYIVTNDHLVRGVKTLTVNLSDGRKFKAKLIGSDTPSDLAVIQIKADKLQAIKLGNSDQARVGDFVAAIGNPFGLKQTVTSGIISALGRADLYLEGPQSYENFIQTDASINPGNSGGALVNLRGELIGINTAIIAPSGGNVGIGFAIPSNMVRNVMEQLISHGSLQRGMVGIMVQNITEEMAHAFHLAHFDGAVVTQITPKSPAANADIQPGDVVTEVDGQVIKNAFMVRNVIGMVRAGGTVKITFIRNGKTKTISIKTSDPKDLERSLHLENKYLYGVGFENFSHVEPIQGHIDGVLVNHVMDNTPSWHAGLAPGDVIVSANSQPVRSIDELTKAERSCTDEYLTLNIRRAGGALFIPIKGYKEGDHIDESSNNKKSKNAQDDNSEAGEPEPDSASQ